MKIAVIFPGWGTPKRLYQKLDFKVDKLLIVDDLDLTTIQQKIASYNSSKISFCGWSLGAMRALNAVKYFEVDNLVLLAPTLNFLENQPEIVVKKMKRNLTRNKLKTLLQFTQLNFYSSSNYQQYIKEYREELQDLNLNYLKEGLDYLLNTDLRELKEKVDNKALVIVGEEDEIISNKSSKKILTKFEESSYFSLPNVGHNLIYEAEEEVNYIIENNLYKATL